MSNNSDQHHQHYHHSNRFLPPSSSLPFSALFSSNNPASTTTNADAQKRSRASSLFGSSFLQSFASPLRSSGAQVENNGSVANNINLTEGAPLKNKNNAKTSNNNSHSSIMDVFEHPSTIGGNRNATDLSINIDSANSTTSSTNSAHGGNANNQEHDQLNLISNPSLATPSIPQNPINIESQPVLTPPNTHQMSFNINTASSTITNIPSENSAAVNSSNYDPAHLEEIVPKKNKNGTYSIRLTPYVDNNSTSTALYFGPIVRKLQPGSTIPVGRYTEKNKEALTALSNFSSPVVFRSKVVSRSHAQIGVDSNGNWHLKDLKSSSGTFLNHRRLSPANQESEEFPFKEGDLLQLGMDFRGGTEEIYRCVKMRVELNKSWIRKTKAFSKEAHERMKKLNLELVEKDQVQCVICLEDIKPCQAVFISPCSHSYHYKCIRRVIFRTYPQFLCPTCRALSDLEAEEDDSDSEDEEDKASDAASFRSGVSDFEMTR